jgi:hypothetical protein
VEELPSLDPIEQAAQTKREQYLEEARKERLLKSLQTEKPTTPPTPANYLHCSTMNTVIWTIQK